MWSIDPRTGDAVSRMLLFLAIVFVISGFVGFLYSLDFSPKPQKELFPSPTVTTITGCKRTGCGSQLCVSADSEEVFTTCEWRPEHACYRDATCERQEDGSCGFTMDDALSSCLDSADSGVMVPNTTFWLILDLPYERKITIHYWIYPSKILNI